MEQQQVKEQFNQVMIDIETLGTGFDSIVTSIAAVAFNETDIDSESNSYFHNLPIAVQAEAGRKISQETWNWWAEQNINPMTVPTNGNEIKPYLIELSSFLNKLSQKGELKIWSNPPSFDIKILEDMYNQYDLPIPWNFRQLCDVRTVKTALGENRYKEFQNENPHSAIDDCKYQIQIVQKFQSILGKDE